MTRSKPDRLRYETGPEHRKNMNNLTASDNKIACSQKIPVNVHGNSKLSLIFATVNVHGTSEFLPEFPGKMKKKPGSERAFLLNFPGKMKTKPGLKGHPCRLIADKMQLQPKA